MPKGLFTVAERQMFRTYGTPEEYSAATQKPCPAFDPAKAVKLWEDLAPTIFGRRTVIYDTVLLLENGRVSVDENGHPAFDTITMTREDAMAVNIPRPGDTLLITYGSPVPVPLKLGPGDELIFVGPMGVVFVHDKSVPLEDSAVSGGALDLQAETLRLVRAIAQKLGVA
jgi:hypothetical protein